ncbi:NAD(P)/FAD-dependent oxidoreductase [Dokdonella sp. MW10]|uniref:NAD(P)/FAD-dependent oxidoreductase n=1 Tax=Dokdonella sp. MW10 TaxID=2992926 RepID=UPI003F7FD57E
MDTADSTLPCDAIVIGGSYAGQSAAMQLARARQRVLVLDAGMRRNRFAKASHGFLGQDGRAPEAIAAEGRSQVMAYPNVHWVHAVATQASGERDRFVVIDDTGHRWQGRRIVLATGVVDELPTIEGLAERWGRSVFHCPYCHGYELDRGRIGVVATSELSMHHALMLPDWGTTTLLVDAAFDPDEAQLASLDARGVTVETTRIRSVKDVATVALLDGRGLVFDGLFVATRTRVSSPLAQQLGCAFETGFSGEFIRTDEFKATTVAGVFACGDAARTAHSVALAVGDGAWAGAMTHRSLLPI